MLSPLCAMMKAVCCERTLACKPGYIALPLEVVRGRPARGNWTRLFDRPKTGGGRANDARGDDRGIRFALDSPLEGDGFELPVPRALGRRPKAIIAASAACRRRSIICGCVGRHQRRRAKAKSRNRSVIARGTGSLNPLSSNG